MSDVDVFIQVKARHSDPDAQKAVELGAMSGKPEKLSAFSRIYWPQTEVAKVLKSRSRFLQFAVALPDGAVRKTVFEYPVPA